MKFWASSLKNIDNIASCHLPMTVGPVSRNFYPDFHAPPLFDNVSGPGSYKSIVYLFIFNQLYSPNVFVQSLDKGSKC